MDAVKAWGFSVCGALVVGSLTAMLAPSSGKFKIFRLTVSAFVLIGILTPFLTVFKNNSTSKNAFFSESSEACCMTQCMQQTLFDRMEEECVLELFPVMRQILLQAGYSEEFGLSVSLKAEDGLLMVDKVHIHLRSLHKIERTELKRLLSQKTGLPIELDAQLTKEEKTTNE